MKRILGLGSCLLALSLAGVVRAQSELHLKALRTRSATPAGQKFFCVGPYSVPECETQVAVVRAVLRKYDSEKLGKWTWVVVRSQDWKQLVSQLHLNAASPAFSQLEYRQTFLDEALIVLEPKRELELVTKWNIPFDQFLDFAVSHELGHAFCNESDEIKAERFGQRLRKRLATLCDTKKQHNLFAEIR
jgi:hypothetical protein